MKRGPETYSSESVPRQRSSRRKVDDPRGEDTGTSSSGVVSGGGVWQRQPGLPGAWDLQIAVLPMEEEVLNTGQRGCIRAGGGAGTGGRRRWKPTKSKPSWAWLSPGRRGVRGGCRRSSCAVPSRWRRARFIGCFGVWALAPGMSGWPFSSTTAHARRVFSPTALAAGSGKPAMAVPATSKPRLPGDLVCLDCFYIGKLKGVGKLWQVTACDAACSFAFAQVIPSVEAIHCARFLKRVLLPAYRKAGWKLKRVLTDHGSEFKGLFDAVCSELGIHHTRTKPRHCWTNGFVETAPGNHPPRALESRLPTPLLHLRGRRGSIPPELRRLL